jgi:DNA repair exonuclease SbcCD nuclease subunit
MTDKNLFKKAAVFTDIHFGLKSNSVTHNSDCNNFIDWFIDNAKKQNCETCLFLGDFHHNRSNINILTLNYILVALEKLNDAFETVYFLPGNHDLYYKDRRDVQSSVWAKHLDNVVIIDDWFTQGNVTIVPWLIGDDYKKIKKITTKYVFGHFELPHFFMNAMIQMPDHGDIHTDDFSDKIDHVFSGHFHKRQTNKNVTYIGNAFPHNYSDSGDDQRGCMVLEWDNEPAYYNWEDCPKYRSLNLSDILEDAASILQPNMHVRVTIDIPISYEEATFIKETFVTDYNLREMTLLPQKVSDDENNNASISYESVDQIVQAEIMNIDSDTYNKQILMTIYQDL